jgi:hypothetical protein
MDAPAINLHHIAPSSHYFEISHAVGVANRVGGDLFREELRSRARNRHRADADRKNPRH